MNLRRVLPWLVVAPCAFAQSALPVPYTFTTFAGAAAIGSTDGAGTLARFNFPQDIVIDAAGNLYVADGSNHTIRKITPAGTVSTLAGKAGYSVASSQAPNNGDGTGSAARLTTPSALALDASGNLYVAGGGAAPIRKITPAGVVTTIPSGSPNGFVSPAGIAVANTDLLYVSDTGNNTIRKITLSGGGSVTTLAGGSLGTTDGTGSAAQFSSPHGLVIDATGTVYVADTGNHTIRKITPAGDVTTFAGTAGVYGHADGLGTAAQFNFPTHLAIDLAGNVYVADYGNSTVRKITPSGAVTTVAGAPVTIGHIDGNFSVARFFTPQGVAVDSAGNVFVVDARDQTIRKVTPAAVTSTIAGLSPYQSLGSTGGAGTDARFSQPLAVAVGPGGEVYVADSQNHTIRKIAPNGFVVTFAGSAGAPGYADGNGAAARFNFPCAVAVDAAGNVYVADQVNSLVRKITPDATVSTVAGRAGVQGPLDGPPGTATLGYMMGLAVQPDGNLVVSEYSHIRTITPGGTVTTLPVAASLPYSYFGGVAVDAAGNINVLDVDFGDIVTITPTGTVTRIKPHFDNASGIAIDYAGNIFVTGRDDHVVWKLAIDGTVSTIGGLFGVRGSSDGVGEEARFENPSGIAVDAAGKIYVTCGAFNSNTIRQGVSTSAPVITAQPQSVTAARGTNAQFSVTANGLPAPTFQWYFNGTVFNGAASSTLSLANVQSSDAGSYTVVVTNPAGAVTSAAAVLTVSSTPVTPPPATSSGGGGGAVSSWFYLALLTLVAGRLANPKIKRTWVGLYARHSGTGYRG